MATQSTGTSPKTKRLGIFPHSIRKFIFAIVIILFLIAGVVWIWQVWGTTSNVLGVIFTVAGVIVGVLALWPSSESVKADTPASNLSTQQTLQSPVQVIINNNPGYSGGTLPAKPPSLSSPTPGPSDQRNDLRVDEIEQFTQDLINSPQSVFDNIIAIYNPPSGVARTGSIPFRVEELMKTAKQRGDFPRLRNAYYNAMGVQPPVKNS